MKKNILFTTLIILIIALNACNKSNQYNVSFTADNLKTDGALAKILTGYALKDNGIPVNPSDALKIFDKLATVVYGGVFIAGTLTIDQTDVTFEPQIGTSLFVSGVKTIKVPTSDLVSISKEPYMLVGNRVRLQTKNGELCFITGLKSTFEPKFCDQEIVDKISAMIQ